VNLRQVLIGDFAPGKPESPLQSEEEKNMKSRTWMWMTVVYLFAALAMSAGMAAQDNPSQDHKPKHHQYKLIDMGTFGGPASELTTNNGVGAGAKILSNGGTLTGSADTPVPDPYSPLCFNASCFVSHAFQWEDGVRTDLGALPGVNSAQGTGVNERGWIAGESQYGMTDPILGIGAGHAVLWRGGELTDLGTLGGYESFAVSVNDAGDVVGLSTVPGPIDPYSFLGQSVHGFFWRDGVMQDVGTLGGPDTFPGIAHSSRGVVAGGSFINSTPNSTTGVPTMDVFLWRDGHIRDLGTLGGTLCCQATLVVNNRLQIAGDSTLAGDTKSHPFLWDDGVMLDLGTLGGNNGFVNWINDAGEVVGYADLPGSQVHDGYLWRHGVMTDLGNLGRTSSGWAINSQHQIVGASRIDDTPGNARAFLWENGGPIVDLNTLIPANSSLLLVYAVNINDQGEIAGLGVPAGCQPADYLLCGRAYLLIPDGDCDSDCEGRIAASQNSAAPAQNVVTMKQGDESPINPVERLRSQMRHRYHLPGQTAAPRD
jgi:probable HAF family extracellular repeat protein